MINPVFLKTFCTLVETNHFTQTAEKLHMTQSGVSQHIKKLEQHLALPLLERHGKQFTLTHAGRQLYQSSLAILASLEKIELEVKNDDPFTGLVSLVLPGSVGLTIYPALLSIQTHHKGFVVDCRFTSNQGVEQAVINAKADFGFTTAQPLAPEVIYETVATAPLCLVTPDFVEHADWQTLLSLGLINHPEGRHHVTQLLSQNYEEFDGFSQLPITGFSNQISLILDPVAQGLGFTVLPQNAVSAYADHTRIKVWPLRHSVSETIYLLKRSDHPVPPHVKTAIHACIEVLQ